MPGCRILSSSDRWKQPDHTGGRPVWNGTGYRTGKISGSPEPVSTGSGGDIGKLSAPVSEDTGGKRLPYCLWRYQSGRNLSAGNVENAGSGRKYCVGGFVPDQLYLIKMGGISSSLSMRREKQFVADASHELKTPLTVIMANAQLLEDQDTNRTGDGKRWLTNIRQEAEEMKTLVEEMLALARSEAERENIVLTECCFSDVVIESVLSFEAVFYQENKELRSDVEEGISLQGNEKQLKQLLKILLDNAEKYSPEGGRAVVQLKRVNGRKARLTVSNTGEAISREKQQEIFERFYRADLSRSDRKGYGLGLAIAKNIVELHRGKIRVESSEGENRFIVELRCV